jgi:hypothetical protein
MLKDFAHKLLNSSTAFVLAHLGQILCLLGGLALGAFWF